MPCRIKPSAKTEPEPLKKIAEHGKAAHKIDPVPPDLLAKVKKAIRP